MITESQFQKMKSEIKSVVEIFFDDTKNSEQTVQLISNIAQVAIGIQGLGVIPTTGGKAEIIAQILAEIGTEMTHAKVVQSDA